MREVFNFSPQRHSTVSRAKSALGCSRARVATGRGAGRGLTTNIVADERALVPAPDTSAGAVRGVGAGCVEGGGG